MKTTKNGGFCEELLNENDSETGLAIFCCYNHEWCQDVWDGSEQWKKVGYKHTFDVAEKAAEVAQKKQQWLAHDKFYP